MTAFSFSVIIRFHCHGYSLALNITVQLHVKSFNTCIHFQATFVPNSQPVAIFTRCNLHFSQQLRRAGHFKILF